MLRPHGLQTFILISVGIASLSLTRVIYCELTLGCQAKVVRDHLDTIHVGMSETELYSIVGRPFRTLRGHNCTSREMYKVIEGAPNCQGEIVLFPYDPPKNKILAVILDNQTGEVQDVSVDSFRGKYD